MYIFVKGNTLRKYGLKGFIIDERKEIEVW